MRQVGPPGGPKLSTAMEMLVSGVARACALGALCRNGCFSRRAALGRSFGFLVIAALVTRSASQYHCSGPTAYFPIEDLRAHSHPRSRSQDVLPITQGSRVVTAAAIEQIATRERTG